MQYILIVWNAVNETYNNEGTSIYVVGSVFGLTEVYSDEACTEIVDAIVATAGEQQYFVLRRMTQKWYWMTLDAIRS